ncbi:MAG: d(CMP) kinase [Sneathiellaceae bacterium]
MPGPKDPPPAEAPLVIAVDGPVAAGKGTLARSLARQFGLRYLDTGSLYRAVAARVRDAGADPSDPAAALAAARGLGDADQHRGDLRDEAVGEAASIVAAQPEVRAALLDYQRRFGATPPGAVLDGRDIGTVIFPDAPVKLFVTATVEARARRRHDELAGRGAATDYAAVLADLRARDARDSGRATAPLVPAADACLLETTELSIEAALAAAIRIVVDRTGRRPHLG